MLWQWEVGWHIRIFNIKFLSRFTLVKIQKYFNWFIAKRKSYFHSKPINRKSHFLWKAEETLTTSADDAQIWQFTHELQLCNLKIFLGWSAPVYNRNCRDQQRKLEFAKRLRSLRTPSSNMNCTQNKAYSATEVIHFVWIDREGPGDIFCNSQIKSILKTQSDLKHCTSHTYVKMHFKWHARNLSCIKHFPLWSDVLQILK